MEKAVFLLILFPLSAGESIQYVRPNATPPEACPSQPCLTLDQYIQNTTRYFTTGAMFVFLPGNHSLETLLNITSASNITFTSESSSIAIVACTERVTVHNVTNLNIKGMQFLVHLNNQEGVMSVFAFNCCQEVVITNSEFRKKSLQSLGKAILAVNTDIIIHNCLFEGMKHFLDGAINTQQGTFMTLTDSNFTRVIGGAVYSERSSILLRGNDFSHNLVFGSGGGIFCSRCSITTMDFNNFHNNSAIGYGSSAVGGAIAIDGGNITATGSTNFSSNTANNGGAISMTNSLAEFREGSNIRFEDNLAQNVGGAMYIGIRSVIKSNTTLIFSGNIAKGSITYAVCGVMCIFNTNTYHPIVNYLSVSLVNNSGTTGGALFIEKTDGRNFTFIYARNNFGGVLGIQKSTVINVLGANFTENRNMNAGVVTMSSSNVSFMGNCTFDRNTGAQGAIALTNDSQVDFRGNIRIVNNIGRSGGGMVVIESYAIFRGNTLFCNNSGANGGALYTEKGKLEFYESTTFIGNSAITYGGGLYASSSSSVSVRGSVTVLFSRNSAIRGGAMYFTLGANITLDWFAVVTTIHNTATEYGGAIYHLDSISIVQCSNVTKIMHEEQDRALTIPFSFLQLRNKIPELLKPTACPNITSYNDSADLDGNFLYGGLLDRSRLSNVLNSLPYDYFIATSMCHHNTMTQTP